MRHTASIMAAALTGLLVPLGAKGQSHDLSLSSTTPAWVREVTNLDQIRDIGAGKDGEVYVAGGWMFAKYDKDGMQRWVREGDLKERVHHAEEIYAVAVGNDRIYTSEGSPLVIDSRQLTAAGIGIGVYTPSAQSIRTILLGDRYYRGASNWRSNIMGIGLDDAGNIYAAGMYVDTLFFGSDTLATFSADHLHDVFLVSYTSEGTLRWSQRVGGFGFDTIMPDCRDYLQRGVFTIDGHGNTYLSGCFGEGAVFGEGQSGEVILPDEDEVRALVSFDATGDLRWVRTFTDLGIQEESQHYAGSIFLSPSIQNITVDAEGNFFVAWATYYDRGSGDSYPDPIILGNATFTEPGGNGAFLTKHAPDGDILWARQIAGESDEHISDITADAQGHIYVGGGFYSSVLQIEEMLLVNSGDRSDGFVARYDAEGNLRWVGHATGPGAQDITAIAVGPSGDLYVTGKFAGTLYLGSEKLEQRGAGLNMFVAKYDAATITSSEPAQELPSAATLMSNYPNPFIYTTTIEYALPASSHVRLSVYDVLGREVAILVDGARHAGKHVSVFDATSLPGGTYFYRLEAAGRARTGAMTLTK